MSLHEGDCDLSCYLQVSAISLTTFLQLTMESVDRGDIKSAFMFGTMAQWAGRTYVVMRMFDMATSGR